MDFDLDLGIQLLARTPATLRELLLHLDDRWTQTDTGPETFSPYDVVGHLIHGDNTDWLPRLRCILEHGDAVPFEPFDRFAMWQWSKGRSLASLLDEFADTRSRCLTELQQTAAAGQGPAAAGTPPGARRRHARPAARHLDGARSQPPGSDRPHDGVPAGRCRRPVAGLPVDPATPLMAAPTPGGSRCS